MNNTYVKRPLSLILALIMVFSLVPFTVSTAGAADPGASSDTRVADASTLNNWQTLFGTANNFTTANSGHVWTDKSVLLSPAELAYAKELSDNASTITMGNDGDNFLVALSAIASSKSITGEANKPTDTVIVLDLSSSMYSGSTKTPETIKAMVDAVNNTIKNLLALNVHNRVGVVIYFGGPDLNQATAPSYQNWLALDRYSHSSNKFLTYSTSSGKLSSVGVNKNVTNSAGKKVTNSTRTVPNVSGTYVQQGLLAALEMFSKADTKVPDNAETQAGVKRTPVIILMSDGKPTAATNKYTNIKSNAVMGSNREDIRSDAETDFLTQLTAAYTKERVAAHYDESTLFYTLSLGNTISYDVMDPQNTLNKNSGKYRATIGGYWDRLISNASIKITAKVSKGQWDASTQNQTFTVERTTVNGSTFPSNKSQQNYVNKAFEAATASDLANAFNNIFTSISLQTHTYSTLVDNNSADLGGYVSFVDKIGKYMSVTDVKGILIGDVWYSGRELSKNFVPGGGSLGTITAPTALGDELVWAYQQRLGLANSNTVRTLLALAYQFGQLSYNSQNNTFSNYVGWYADAQGKYLGFWQEGASTTPANAVYTIKSYIYLGTTDAAHGVSDSDLMYATVQHRTEIATGEESVTFAIPAALLPTVTYDIALDSNGNPTSIVKGGAANPIRLVYEVALDDAVNELTLLDPTVVDPAYISANTNADGSVNFYTNQYEVDNSTGYGKVNTYSYFRPAHNNENYYFQHDETVYTDTKGTVYKSTSAPNPSGTFYRHTTVYKLTNGTPSAEDVYLKLSYEALSTAIQRPDTTWYVSRGNVHADLARYVTAKQPNATGTLPNVEDPFVDIYNHNVNEADHYFVIGYTLGNNGRLSLTPATGIKVTKTVSVANTDANANTSFLFTLTNKSNPSDSSTYPAYLVNANGDTLKTSITFKSGAASISIANGDSFYIVGMKSGDVINVAESETEYYVTASVNGIPAVNNTDVTLADQNIISADFVNIARGKGDLTVAKDIEHSLGTDYQIPAGKKFTIKVTLSSVDVRGKTFTAIHSNDTSFTSVTVGNDGSFTVALADGEEITVKDLPEGTVATVVEEDPGASFTASYFDNGAAGDGVVTVVKENIVSVIVVNNYKVTKGVPNNVKVNATKNFVDAQSNALKDWKNETFRFTLQKHTASGWVDVKTLTATQSNPTVTFDLSSEEFTAPGVYAYQLFEVIPADADKLDGVHYDTTYHTFSVTVTDTDMDGVLEITRVHSEHANKEFSKDIDGKYAVDVSFTNTQTQIAPVTAEIPVKKLLVNASGSDAVSLSGYKFGVYTDAACTSPITIGNGVSAFDLAITDNVGEAFLDITFDAKGEYTFYIKEINTGIASMTYSDRIVKAVITVVYEDGSSRFNIASINYTEHSGSDTAALQNASGELQFTNTYKPTDTTLTVDVRKELKGRDLVAGEFNFAIREYNATAPYTTGTNDANGKVTFDKPLTFDKVGTYFFDVYETSTDANGVVTDKSVRRVTVKVTDNNGALTASYIIENVAENYIVFTNNYEAKPVEYTVKGLKKLEGRQLVNDEFGFTLTPCDSTGTPTAGATVLSARNALDGSFSFAPLKFTAAGTYYYLAAEKQENTAYGVTYDKTEYIVQIVVKDDLKGQLVIDSVTTIVKLARVNTADGIVFTNVYVPAPTSGIIGGTKFYTTDISGTVENLDLSKVSFTFNLYHSDEDWATGAHIQTVQSKADGSFAFDKFDYNTTGTHYYLVKELHGGTTVNGIKYDASVYRVKIEVTDNGKGQLNAEISIYNEKDIPQDSITFSNTYVINDTAKVVFNGQKQLHNLTLEKDQFSFVLIDTTDNKSNTTPLETVTNAADGSFVFTEIEYTKPGTYTYVIKEVNGGQRINGITYDATQYSITVEVTDNGAGKLLVTASTEADNISFINTYSPDPVKVPLSGTKTLTGRDLIAGEFSFTLINSKDDVVETVTNTVSATDKTKGSFSFTDLVFDTAGTYTYTVAEAIGFKGGITYDNTKYTVTVTVTDDGKGTLSAKVAIADSNTKTVDSITFTNSYSANSTSASFKGLKEITGRKLAEGEFSFILKDETGKELETVKNFADGSFHFSALTYNKVGTYKYTVSELNAGQVINGVTYSEQVFNITVNVTDDGEGKLLAEVIGADAIKFSNTYKADPAKISIGGIKKLNGRTFKAGEFSFILKDESGNTLETVSNNADGSFKFSDIDYKAAGTYKYTVTEENAGKTVNGITYSNQEYDIIVTVKDDGAGKLIATANITTDALEFVNNYEAKEVSIAISGTKELTGRALAPGEFRFVLTDANGKVIETVSNNADKSFSFSAITYKAVGTYVYTVHEIKGNLGGIKYDEKVIRVEVIVSDNGLGQLTATVKPAEPIVFNNIYTTAPGTVEFSAKKELEGKELEANEFSFLLTETTPGSTYSETVKNDNFGIITFSKIKYSAPGIYTYTITEIKGDRPNVDYDTAPRYITVTVTDNGDGTLSTVVSESAANIVFKNKYNVTPTYVTLSGKKELEGRALITGEFTFVLTDTSTGDIFKSVTNEADGTFTFKDIEYTSAGIYRYTLSEVNDGRGGVTYDETVYDIVITVTDNGVGVLSNTVEIYKNVSSGTIVARYPVDPSEIKFVNLYDTTAAHIQFIGTKVLIGRKLNSGEFRFELTDVDGNILDTAVNNADGVFGFETITYTEPGHYLYFISEANTNKEGILYDHQIITALVYVRDDGEGKLSATVSLSGQIRFTNYYILEPAEIEISARKVLNGRDLKGGEFTFELTSGAGDIRRTVTNSADGTIDFGTFKYTDEGRYTYRIREIKGNLEHVTYDSTVHVITVEIKDTGKGKLIAIVNGANDIVFTNEYDNPDDTTAPEETTEVPEDTTGPDDTTEVPDETTGPDDTTDVPDETTGPDDTTDVPDETTGPDDTTDVPDETTGPDDTTDVPDETTGPDDTTDIPDETTGPDDTTEVPDETTGPDDTTDVPGDTTGPDDTTDVPGETTGPDDTTDVPDETTGPDDTTDVPDETTGPDDTTDVPGDTTGPDDTTDVPGDTTDPDDTTGDPGDTTDPDDTTGDPDDTTNTPEETTDPENTKPPFSPGTGDGNKFTVWFGAIIVAFCVTAGALFSKKRETEDEE